MNPFSRRALAAVAAALALAPAAGRAVDRLVPSQYPTIQEAIDAAGSADAIVVSPGTYRENLIVDGKGCTIRSTSGNPADTILDGSAASTSMRGEPTVAFLGNAQATIRGFTIRGGKAENSSHCPNMPHTGGGICVDGASPTIEDNVITANASCSGGTGIGVWERSSPIIRRNRIVANTASTCSGGGAGGGGVMLEGGSADVLENLIANNDCSLDGGGIAATAGTHRIERNVVRDNHTWGFGGGLATGINGRRLSLGLTIAGNLFHGNRAEDGAGGLYFHDGTAAMAGNTVAQNTGVQLHAADWGGDVSSTNDVIDGSVLCAETAFGSGVIDFGSSLVSGTVTGSGCAFTPGVNGNVSATPRFVAPAAKDFHLRPDSPGVDAGAAVAALPALDLDGEARTIGTSPDIGADEFAGLVGATVVPASHDHGAQKVGTVGPAFTTTLTNDGATPLRVSPVSSSSGEFAASTTCVGPGGIAPGASCTVSVTFRPTVKGLRSGIVTVESNAVGTPHSISVSGTATAPVIALDPAAIDFGDVRTHTTEVRTITVTNVGDAGSAGLAVAVQGAGISAVNGCAGLLAVGASCAIEVSFAPSARGALSGAKLTVTGDGYNLPVEATLDGRGVAPVIQVSTASMAFGAVKVGASADEPLTISNVGELPLLLSSITTAGDFSEASACGPSVGPGASCELTVTFSPTDGGSRTGQLVVVHDADGSPTAISLAGMGQDFSIAAYPSSLTVPSGAVAQMSALVQLEGGWGDPVSVSCSGMPAPGRCVLAPTSVVPGGNGLVTVELHTSPATLAAAAAAAADASGPLALAGLLLFPGAWIWAGRRTRRRQLALLAAVAAAALVAGGCGGGGPAVTGGGASKVSPGTYPITITATSAGVQRAATISLRVADGYP
jgi:hypothetical protein